ncbi:hypothetical protein JTB14_015895 [Gonioctena quinquepunctata]|nr:hypothetical protein JTB14_015895 [Gonioctena quinquepunctata]
MAQKLIIPRGLVSPNQTIVVDIPQSVSGSSSVMVARRPRSVNRNGQMGSYMPPPPINEYSGSCPRGRFSPTQSRRTTSAEPPCPEECIWDDYGNKIPYRKDKFQTKVSVDDDEQDDAEKMNALQQLEYVEKEQMSEDLRNFQKHRRKLVYDLANVAPDTGANTKKTFLENRYPSHEPC